MTITEDMIKALKFGGDMEMIADKVKEIMTEERCVEIEALVKLLVQLISIAGQIIHILYDWNKKRKEEAEKRQLVDEEDQEEGA